MTTSDQKIRFAILDPLRMLAALAVVFYHYSVFFDERERTLVELSKYGYLGVDFFFLLSGFVIMASAQNRTAFAFAFSRAIRIYPTFIVCLLLTVVTVNYIGGVSFSYKNILFNATILNDYINIPNIDGVYWTLQAELKFYGCIFLLIVSGSFKYWRIWLSVWLAISIVYFFLAQPFFMGWFINPQYSFYFIAGVCSYLLFDRDKSVLIKIIFWLSTLFGCLIAGDQIKNFIPDPSSGNVLVARVIVLTFFLFFYALSLGVFNIRCVGKWWVYCGAMSYPLYLLHNTAGKTFINYFRSELNIYILIILVLLMVLAISLIVHLFVEKPINLLVRDKLKK